MSDLKSLFQKIQLDAISTKTYYVYYTADTGEITKISPRFDSSQTSILKIEEETALPFLKGEKQFTNYKVIFNLGDKSPSLIEKSKNNLRTSYTNVLYKIPEQYEDNSDITIIQDFVEKKWKICLSQSTREFASKHKTSFQDSILLSVTKKDDPNILYKNFYILLEDLLKNDVYISFDSEFELKKQNLSIYTSRYFETYSYYRIKDE